MPKRMLIDATHAEETRVAVVDHNLKLEQLDIVHAGREPLKGNIYLAKVRRIEPSLQAAFVEYGGNRQGFLPFAEIHPDYFKIPVADREALLAKLAAAEAKAAERSFDPHYGADYDSADDEDLFGEDHHEHMAKLHGEDPYFDNQDEGAAQPNFGLAPLSDEVAGKQDPFQPIDLSAVDAAVGFKPLAPLETSSAALAMPTAPTRRSEPELEDDAADDAGDDADDTGDEDESGAEAALPAKNNYDTFGGDDDLEEKRRRIRRQFLRNYRIQEVIKRGQVMLIQVVKEERGNKGAAITTYLSLAGRYCVLMPNSDKSGGVSRKINSPADRKRLKEMLDLLEVPQGMSVILRTAGLEQPPEEIKRDFDYLQRLWDQIRETTFSSTAPALVYEEANLIKRAIRDYFSRDMDAVVVEGAAGFKTAQQFMQLLMPSHAARVLPYENQPIPLFTRYQVEAQVDRLYEQTVQLPSGGYIIISPTEALVAIDVNSGRATRERHIEETALRTNMEAAEEVARQIRLRDLAGLVVIDFIDMDDYRHNHKVERRLKDAMKHDRARLQIGRISPFGLLELSRQRLRPSLLETNFEKCPHCTGTGHIRSADSAALTVLRAIEEEGIRQKATEIAVNVPSEVAIYILNEKREALSAIETRYGFRVFLRHKDDQMRHEFSIERLEARAGESVLRLPSTDPKRVFNDHGAEMNLTPLVLADADRADFTSADDVGAGEAAPRRERDGERGERGDRGERRRGGRNRRGGRGDARGERSAERPMERPAPAAPYADQASADDSANDDADNFNAEAYNQSGLATAAAGGAPDERGERNGERDNRRRRGRRGGRNRRDGNREAQPRDGQPRDGQRDMNREGYRDNTKGGRGFLGRNAERPARGDAPADGTKTDSQPPYGQNFAAPRGQTGNYANSSSPQAYNVTNVLEIDTTPKDKSGNASADGDKPKSGWWRRWTS